jgi:23S rRNA (uridine2552-2'-O)-methyltransferase
MAKGNAWQRRQQADPYVAKARHSGYRGRAAFKLAQIDDRDGLLKPGSVVVDLGAAPGGWTQVAVERVGRQGRVVAVDYRAMEPVPGATVVQADFTTDEGLAAVEEAIGGQPVDVVLSDMAPDLSGIKSADQARSMELCELAVELADQHLRRGGSLLVKAFQGEGFDELLAGLRGRYDKVAGRKPDASRKESAEQYVVARGFRGT